MMLRDQNRHLLKPSQSPKPGDNKFTLLMLKQSRDMYLLVINLAVMRFSGIGSVERRLKTLKKRCR